MQALAVFEGLNPMVYVIVFAMAFFKSLADCGTVTGRDVAAAGYSGVCYCFVAFLLSLLF